MENEDKGAWNTYQGVRMVDGEERWPNDDDRRRRRRLHKDHREREMDGEVEVWFQGLSWPRDNKEKGGERLTSRWRRRRRMTDNGGPRWRSARAARQREGEKPRES